MSDKTDGRLRRYEYATLPPVFDQLTDEDKVIALQKMLDSDLELRRVMLEKLGKSKIADIDLQLAIDTINVLQDERKVFTQKFKGETGSGTYEIQVRGGDTRFIMSIALATIAIMVLIGIVWKLF